MGGASVNDAVSVHGRRTTVDRFLEHYYRVRPVNATFTGMHDHDHLLPDWSRAGTERAIGEMRALRAEIAAHGAAALADASVASREWDAIDLALADSFLEIQLAELGGRQFQCGNPSLVIGEAAFSVISLMIRDFAPIAQRGRMARSRLAALPRFFASALSVVGEGPVPGAWAEKALAECDGLRALLGEGLDRWRAIDGIPAALSEALRHEGDVALGALEGFATELAGMPRDAAPARACGEEMLSLLLRRGHWIERSLDELHRELRERYALERTRLDEMARAADPLGLAAVQARLSAAHPGPDEYYHAFGETWRGCHDVAAQHDLVTWPDFPIRYVPIPEYTRKAAASLYYLFYRSPAPLEPPDVHDYVVTPIEGMDQDALERHLRVWNDSTIKLNHVVHHGALGHHVQNWYAFRSPSRLGRIAATDCAARIGMFLGGSMAEGWACYATDLMNECGFLTPDERVAEQHTQVRMLARALVDIEFHTGRRPFDDAVALYRDEVGMTPIAARGEATKNSMFPGTAMMYWLGTSQIHSLREAMERRDGAGFSLRAFHDELLSFGSIPVSLSSRLMLAS